MAPPDGPSQTASDLAREPAYRSLGVDTALTLEEGLDQLADAIRDPTRRRILVGFYGDPAPRTANDVADQAGISRPVARTHLELLRSAGFLRHEPRRGFRGKPAHLYTLDTTSPSWMPHPPRQMALLSMLVLEAASLGPDEVGRLVEQVGYDYGQSIHDFRGNEVSADVTDALRPLRLMGATVEVEPVGRGRDRRVTIDEPLFAAAARGRRDLLASLHLGIIRALVADLGLSVSLDEGLDHDGLAYILRPARGRGR